MGYVKKNLHGLYQDDFSIFFFIRKKRTIQEIKNNKN